MITHPRKLKKYASMILMAAFLAFAPFVMGMHGLAPAAAHAQIAPPNLVTSLASSGGGAVASAVGSKLAEVGSGVVEGFVNFGGQFLLMLGSAILYLGGLLFDWIMDLFVVNFTAWVKAPEIWNAITSTWSIVRDVCNLIFIFGFIYIGISTIIDPERASVKRFLAKIVIGAILINFSLYLTQVVIDVSNFTAVQVYNAINPNDDQSIASAIKSYLGTDQAFFNISGDDLATIGEDWAKGAAYYFLVCIFLMVAGLTLLIAAFHLLIRFIELLLIMIFSPIYFAAQVFPGTEKHAEKILGRLISSAFYAPVYLLLLYLVLMIANAFTQRLQGDFVATLVRGDVGAAGVIVNYCIVIALMWSAIHLGKMMSVTGGDIAIKWGTKARQSAQRGLGAVTFGVPARMLRATAGRKMHEYSESDKLKDAVGRGGWRGSLAKVRLKSARAVGDASFDARNVDEFGKKTGLGEGKKGGYKTLKEEVEKKEKEFGKSLGTVEDSDVRVEGRKKEMEEAKKRFDANKQKLTAELRETKDENKRLELQGAINKLEKDYNDAKINYEKEKQRRILGSTYASESDEIAALRDKIKKMKGEHLSQSKEKGKTQGLKRAWEVYLINLENKTDEVKREELAVIEDYKKDIEEQEKLLTKMLTKAGDRGYAGKLENRSHLASWAVGRLSAHDREAGKEMRKTAEKGLPKEKE